MTYVYRNVYWDNNEVISWLSLISNIGDIIRLYSFDIVFAITQFYHRNIHVHVYHNMSITFE